MKKTLKSLVAVLFILTAVTGCIYPGDFWGHGRGHGGGHGGRR